MQWEVRFSIERLDLGFYDLLILWSIAVKQLHSCKLIETVVELEQNSSDKWRWPPRLFDVTRGQFWIKIKFFQPNK